MQMRQQRRNSATLLVKVHELRRAARDIEIEDGGGIREHENGEVAW